MNSLRPRTKSSSILSGKRSAGLFMLALAFISIIGSAALSAQSINPDPYCNIKNTGDPTMQNRLEGITEVSVGGTYLMDVTTHAPVYQDWSSVQPFLEVVPGQSYTFYVKTGEGNPYGFIQNVKVWIDYNGDGVFDNATEVAHIANSAPTGGLTRDHYFDITIQAPANGVYETRMRIVSDNTANTMTSTLPCAWDEAYTAGGVLAGNCRDFTISFGAFPDAGAIGIAAPVAPYEAGTDQPVKIVIKNYGESYLRNCQIIWKVDNDNPQTYTWNSDNDPLGPIAPQGTREVLVGNYNFTHKRDAQDKNWTTYEISAATANPNTGSGVDQDLSNDAIPLPLPQTAPAVQTPQSYNIGGTTPDFQDNNGKKALELASEYISVAGILGDDVLEFNFFSSVTYNSVVDILNMNNGESTFILTSADPADKATITLDVMDPQDYVMNIENSSNIIVRDLNFEVDANSGNAGLINIEDSRDIYFYNNVFTVLNPNPALAQSDNIMMNIKDSYNVVIGSKDAGNSFVGGGTMIAEYASTCPRKFTVVGNEFKNFSFIALQMQGANDATCSENIVLVDNNDFTIDNGFTPQYGVASINGTTISENRFVGLNSNTAGFPVASAIYLMHTPLYPTQSDVTIVKDNLITDCENIHGVEATDIPNLRIESNQITIEANMAGNTPNATGIYLDGCGADEISGYALVKDNKIRIAGATVANDFMDVNGIYTVDSKIKIYNNDVNINDNEIHASAHAAGYFNMSTGYIANNWFSADKGSGVRLIDSKDIRFFYNAVNINSNDKYAVEIAESGSQTFTNNNTIARNLFMNRGNGQVALFDDQVTIVSEQNNFWTAGLIIGTYMNAGTPVAVDAYKNLDGDMLSDQTMSDWEMVTNTGNPGGTPSSLAHAVEFEAFDVLRIVNIDEDMIYDNELTFDMFGFVAGTSEFDILNDEIQLHGWDGQERTKFTIGTYNIIPIIEIDLQPLPVVNCWETPNQQISTVAFATGGVQPKYEWFKDGKSLTELYDANNPDEDWANKAILYLDDMIPFRGYNNGLSYDMQGVYHCVVSAGAAEEVISEKVLVAVLRNPLISRQPENKTVELGETIMLDAEAQIYGGIDESINLDEFEVDVQWYDASVIPAQPIMDSDRISGSKSTMLQIRKVADEDIERQYYVRMVGHCGTVQSETVELKAAASIAMDVQPVDITACEGTAGEVIVDATISNGDGTEKVMFTLYKDGMEVGTAQESNTITMPALTQDDEGTYTVMAAVVPGTATVMSDAFMVDVLASATITATTPADTDVDVADNSGTFTLGVTAQGDGALTYTWEFNGNTVGGEETLSVEAATFTAAEHGGKYTCTVTNECGSDVVEFNVTIVAGGIVMNVVDDVENAVQLSNDPNPVSNMTTIKFNADTEAARLALIDQSGREVAVLVDGNANIGQNEVKVNADALNLSSGVYYYTLTINGVTITNKMIVVK